MCGFFMQMQLIVVLLYSACFSITCFAIKDFFFISELYFLGQPKVWNHLPCH